MLETKLLQISKYKNYNVTYKSLMTKSLQILKYKK